MQLQPSFSLGPSSYAPTFRRLQVPICSFFSHTLNFCPLLFSVKLQSGDQKHRKDGVPEPYFTFKELDEELPTKLSSGFCFQWAPVRLFSMDDACLVLLFSTRNGKKLKCAVQDELLCCSLTNQVYIVIIQIFMK